MILPKARLLAGLNDEVFFRPATHPDTVAASSAAAACFHEEGNALDEKTITAATHTTARENFDLLANTEPGGNARPRLAPAGDAPHHSSSRTIVPGADRVVSIGQNF